MSDKIHPTAVIAEGAQIADDVEIGPYSVVGPKVVIGKGTVVGSHVVIEGHTTIGEENKIFQFASVGAVPQDLKYHGEDTRLEIGNKNLSASKFDKDEEGNIIWKQGDENDN